MADKEKILSIKKSGINSSVEKTKKKRILIQDSSDSEVECKKQVPEDGINADNERMKKTKRLLIEESKDTADVGPNPGTAQISVQSACQLCSTLLPRLEAMEKNHTNLLNKLTQEVISLRKELRGGHKADNSLNNNFNILPERPFSKLIEFIQFEKKLTGNSARQEQLAKELKNSPRTTAAQFIRNGWKRIMNDELSALFVWRGSKTKRSLLGLTTTATFRTAFIQQFAGVEEDFFERSTTNWFNSSPDRVSKNVKLQSDIIKVY